jgi:putative FmdB family regulatory protein
MPLYEYDCLACGERFEIAGSVRQEDRKARCPNCDGDDVRRHYGSVAVLHHGHRTSAPGELRPADPARLTGDVARRYASSTGDSAMSEVARQVDAGAGPAELQEFVRGVKAERHTHDGKRRGQK